MVIICLLIGIFLIVLEDAIERKRQFKKIQKKINCWLQYNNNLKHILREIIENAMDEKDINKLHKIFNSAKNYDLFDVVLLINLDTANKSKFIRITDEELMKYKEIPLYHFSTEVFDMDRKQITTGSLIASNRIKYVQFFYYLENNNEIKAKVILQFKHKYKSLITKF